MYIVHVQVYNTCTGTSLSAHQEPGYEAIHVHVLYNTCTCVLHVHMYIV